MTFSEFREHCDALARKISEAGYEPTQLVALARGGWVPTRMLSDSLGVKKIQSVGITYTYSERTILDAYSLPEPFPSGEVLLLIEDCLESGKSLERAVEIFSSGNTVKTASLFVTPKTRFSSDFNLGVRDEPPIFPWE